MMKYKIKQAIAEIIFPLTYLITLWKMKAQTLQIYTDEETRQLVRGGIPFVVLAMEKLTWQLGRHMV